MERTLLASIALSAFALAGCHHDLTCSTEVTQGSGVFRGTALGARAEVELRRESVRIACGQLCAAGGSAKTEGCVARCAVDAEAGKIGARTSCSRKDAAR